MCFKMCHKMLDVVSSFIWINPVILLLVVSYVTLQIKDFKNKLNSSYNRFEYYVMLHEWLKMIGKIVNSL